MKFNRRLALLFGCLAVIAGLVIHDRMGAGNAEQSVVEPLVRADSSYRAPAQTEGSDVLALASRAEYAKPEGDAFATPKKAPPPPPVEVAPPPPAPKAPPIPFTFIGKEFDAGAWRVFLAQQDSVLVATEGALITEEYKVKKIHPPTMELLYVPLNETQVFGIGAPHND